MSFNEKSLFWICVILTMGMAFTAMMISLPRTVDVANPTRLDYQGTIVTTFALLVTVLIGWQIYSALGLDHRIYKAEKRISNMLSQLKIARDKIDTNAQSSEDYTSGVNCLSIAMIEYTQTIFNKRASLAVKTKHYCTCYMVSANAMRYLLNSNKDLDTIYPIITMCVEGIELSSKLLFSSEYITHTTKEFTQENHNICEEHYDFFKDKVNIIGIDNIRVIDEAHSKRLELLSSH